MEVTQPLSYWVDELQVDVRPLRAQFETLALAVRNARLAQGLPEPVLAVALDLRYADQDSGLTVPFPLEAEDAGVCFADPRPLDTQALREAVAMFHVAYATQYGNADRNARIQVVRLRVRTADAPPTA